MPPYAACHITWGSPDAPLSVLDSSCRLNGLDRRTPPFFVSDKMIFGKTGVRKSALKDLPFKDLSLDSPAPISILVANHCMVCEKGIFFGRVGTLQLKACLGVYARSSSSFQRGFVPLPAASIHSFVDHKPTSHAGPCSLGADCL